MESVSAAVNQPSTGALFCSDCGKENTADAKFCSGCGMKITSVPAANTEAIDPLIGQDILGRFKVKKLLGAGGMGRVYLAEQTSIGRQIALKVLSPEYSKNDTLKERFRNEAALSSRLSHPCTVIIYDFGITEDGALFIAMELIDGRGLDAELKEKGKVEWPRMRDLAVQICGSLQNAHDNAIIHRDLKPENIMLSCRNGAEELVKVLDFGIAKILSGEDEAIRKGLTAPNEIFGTPEYMSPEQARGDEMDARTDIYSLGVIFYYMLTGRLPFEGDVPIAVLAKHLTEEPPVFSVVNPSLEIPEGAESLVLSMMAKDKSARPGSMSEVIGCLREIGSDSRTPVSVDAVVVPPKIVLEARKPVQVPSEDSAAKVVQTPAAPESKPSKVSEPAESAESVESATEIDETADSETENNQEATIDKLLLRVKKMRDFPTISQHISELNTKASLSSTSASQLANVILKDTSLTTKLIKLVNSPYYGNARGRITMISRAVVLIGFEAVRESALGLLLFDHLQSSDPRQADELREAAIGSALSGLVAKSMAKKISGMKKEEAFVCSMFHGLGKHVAIFCFPDEMGEVRRLIEGGMFEDRAVLKILGVSYDELGRALGSQWNFPDQILNTMRPLPKGNLVKPRSPADKLQHLSSFSNELSAILARVQPDKREAAFKNLAQRFQGSFEIKEEEIEKMVEETAENLEEYARIMDLRPENSLLVRNVLEAAGVEVESQKDSAKDGDSETVEKSAREISEQESIPGASLSRREGLSDKEVVTAREQILVAGSREVAAALRGRYDLNTVMLMALETMFRGLGLSHVIFCLNDVKVGKMRARSGFGEGVDEMIQRFSFNSKGGFNLFNRSLSMGQDVVVPNSLDRRFAPKIPKWYKDLVNAPMFMLYPIMIKSFPAALFYGDMDKADVNIDRVLLEQMNVLRDNASTAIRKSPQFGGR